MTPLYSLLGLTLSCPFDLGEQQSRKLEPEVTVALEVLAPPAVSTHPFGVVSRRIERTTFHWADAGAMEVSNGSRIVIDPVRTCSLATLRAMVKGFGMATLFAQRGTAVLHATVVNMGGRAIAISGFPGAGKSTTAASLAARGHKLINDDVCPIGADLAVPPGSTRVKLLPDSLRALGHEPACLPVILSDEKRELDLGSGDGSSLPLGAVYVLTPGEVNVKQLCPGDATAELIRHSWNVLTSPPGATTTLTPFSKIAAHVPVFALSRTHTLADLDRFTSLLEDHVAAHVRTPSPVASWRPTSPAHPFSGAFDDRGSRAP